ncbi:MAG TPA: alpha/beta hydrolase [Longimicrobiales bacterium]
MSLLSQEEIRSEEPGPERLYVLHGIFGAGRNWASVMRRFVRSCPDWSARLIDLRQHGNSQGFAPPHTIEAAARDLFELSQQLKETPTAVLGHSFGGKVALMYAREHGSALKQVWIVDSTPEARVPDGSAWQMLELIRKTPREFESREQLIALLTQFGVARPTAQWMATNLENQNSVYRWRFDFDAMEELLRDFFAQDMWDVLESPPGTAEIHLVKAQESSVLSAAAVARIHQIGLSNHRVFLHQVAGGHWVNAENPEGLLALLTQHLT